MIENYIFDRALHFFSLRKAWRWWTLPTVSRSQMCYWVNKSTLHKVNPVLGLAWQVAGRHKIAELRNWTKSEAASRGNGALHTLVCHQTKSDAMPTPQCRVKWTSANHHRIAVIKEGEICPAQVHCSFQTTQSWWHHCTNIDLKRKWSWRRRHYDPSECWESIPQNAALHPKNPSASTWILFLW